MLDGGSGVEGVKGQEGSQMGCSCRMWKTRAKDRWPARGQAPGGRCAPDSEQYSVSCSLLILLLCLQE